MTKLEEILDKHTNVLKDDATHVLTVRVLSNAMREYAEWYAHLCLESAAKNCEITCGSTKKSYELGSCTGFCEGGGCEYAVVKTESITDLTTPSHD